MFSISTSNLQPLGINLLTGEACAYSMRVLCDLSPEGALLIQDYFGLTPTSLRPNWNSQVGDAPAVASVMLGRSMFRALIRFALFRRGTPSSWSPSVTPSSMPTRRRNSPLVNSKPSKSWEGNCTATPTLASLRGTPTSFPDVLHDPAGSQQRTHQGTTMEINFDVLKEAVLAVEENNRINGGQWSDWGSPSHIADTYAVGPLGPAERQILKEAIATNGASVESAMQQLHEEVWGVQFNTWR